MSDLLQRLAELTEEGHPAAGEAIAAIQELTQTVVQLRDRLRNGPRKIVSVDDFFAEAKLLDLTAADLVPKLRQRPEFAAEVAEFEYARSDGDEPQHLLPEQSHEQR